MNEEHETCPDIGDQAVNVSVPISVKPFVKTGKQANTDVNNGMCEFSIGQNLIVDMPVTFGS